MEDLEIAEWTLRQEDVNLVIVRGGKIIYESNNSGVQGLLNAIEVIDLDTSHVAVGDRIVGRGSAFLCAYLGADAVFGLVVAKPAREVFEENNIDYRAKEFVENIQNRDGSGICPFEKLTKDISDVETAYREIRDLAGDLAEE